MITTLDNIILSLNKYREKYGGNIHTRIVSKNSEAITNIICQEISIYNGNIIEKEYEIHIQGINYDKFSNIEYNI